MMIRTAPPATPPAIAPMGGPLSASEWDRMVALGVPEEVAYVDSIAMFAVSVVSVVPVL
jgi:hypothetical protein